MKTWVQHFRSGRLIIDLMLLILLIFAIALPAMAVMPGFSLTKRFQLFLRENSGHHC